MSASKSHFHDCLFWRGGVKPDDCICISCTARKCLIAETKTSICISWIHTSITKITSHPDFSKVIKMPAKHLEIRPCYSLQCWQLKIFQRQTPSFYSRAKGKKILNLLLPFLKNKNVKREISQDLGAHCIWSFDIKLAWPYLCRAGGGCNAVRLAGNEQLISPDYFQHFITNETLNPLSLVKPDTKQIALHGGEPCKGHKSQGNCSLKVWHKALWFSGCCVHTLTCVYH